MTCRYLLRLAFHAVQVLAYCVEQRRVPALTGARNFNANGATLRFDPYFLSNGGKALTILQWHDLAVFQNWLAKPQVPASPFLEDLSVLRLSALISAILPLTSNQTGRTARFASTESGFCNAPAFSRRPRTVELSSVLQALGASRCAQDLS